MVKFRKTGRSFAIFMALSVLAGSVNLPEGGIGTDNAVSAASLETGDRILVDLNRNDGRTVAHSLNGENWILDDGESSRSTTIEGLSMTISASGGELKIVDNKKLHFYNEQYSRLMCDGMTVDADSGGTLKLMISGLSDGTHSIKTYHAATGNETTSTLSVTINGKTSTGVMCPNQVTKDDDAGLAYATFTGTSVTVEIKPEGSGNAWLNAFEIDGGDPINGVNHTYPIDQEKHLEREKGLSWTAGKNAKSHNVYIGTSYDDVFSATTSSKEFKGNQTGTTYALNDSYTSVKPYYWRVDTVDSSGNVIKGSVYSFYVARLAFPTAEGYGRYARGGQGGVVVHVTNLNDSGEGSLRWALCDEKWQEDEYEGVPRIIVFDVGGVIKLESRLTIPNNGGSVYVAGQTAPGDGITVTQYDFGALGSDDVIIRDVRTRIGDYAGKSMGGMGLGSCDNSIIDHCSISWATDEGFSSRQSKDITFQWNIIGESLHDSVHYNGDDRTQTETHAFAASIGGDVGSFHHNLLIDCTGRNWSLAGGLEQNAVEYAGYLDIKNNVVYNWRDRTTDGGINSVNFVNNYYKAGAESDTDLHFIDISDEICNGIQRAYVSGNKMVTSSGGTIVSASDDAWALDRARISSGNQTQAEGKMNSEMWEDYIELESADDAYKSVIAAAGAGGTSETGWDYIDSRYIKEVTNGTYTYKGSKQGLKGIIDSQNDAGGYPTSSNFAHSNDGMCNSKNDTDRDGMPNTWEEAHGLDPNDSTDGAICTLSADGYTNVEMFLNELMGDPVEYNGNGGSSLKKGATFDTAYKYEIADASSGSLLENVERWAFTEIGSGYYQLTDAETGEMLSETEGYKFVKKGETYTIYTQSSEDTEIFGGEGTTWTVTRLLDPINGELVQELIPLDETYYASWKIDTSIAVGDPVFGDRDATYVSLPDEIIGAESILTPCDAKKLETDLATFEADTNMTVYIGLDQRVTTVPAWLSDWTNTGLTAVSSNDVTFVLYAKEVNAGDSITLGTNGQSSGCMNYTVFASAEESLIGDVNADGKFSVADVVMLQKWLICSPGVALTDWQAGDLCEDGRIDAFDLCIMKRELIKNN
ncbi:MAG: dockerin type I repeat-containing protein [Ruminococcus sp.]|nr:dockerin type I repeat-containing protein [Ruminococcus sp.]